MTNNLNSEITVSVLIPCLDEAATIGVCVKKAKDALNANKLAGEVIVADNGSADNSRALAEQNGAKVVLIKEKGYGAALMGGMAVASGRYIVMGDADDSYDFSQLAPFIDKLREGYDLVMGCRLPAGGGRIMPGAMPWAHRWIGNPLFTAIGKLFFRSPIHDINCGMRAFTGAAYEKMDLRTIGMEFAPEMVIKTTLQGLKITEIPITLNKDGRGRRPHLRSLRDGWRTLRFMLLYCPRWLFLIPGAALLILGLVIGSILEFGPIWVGRVGFDASTQLVCAMSVLIGFQLIVFAVFTKVFAISENLLPSDHTIERLFEFIKLETGLVAGLITTLLGLAILIYAVWNWKAHGFGPMSYPQNLRLTIPAVTLLVLGLEIIFASFFLSILGLKRK